jgi:hypothetical protein
VKLAILTMPALAQIQAPWGVKTAVTALAVLSALLSAGLAVFWGERPVTETLNYWDDVVAFLAIGVAAH